MRIQLGARCLFTLLIVSGSSAQTPLGTAFTYQGRLENAGSLANGLHDLRCRLYREPTGGAQIGTTLCYNDVSVSDGLLTVPLDFGAQFVGEERFLEIEVRADTGLDCTNAAAFVILVPRQALASTPHAVFALNAAIATDAALLNGQPASFYQNASNLTSGTLSDGRLSGTYNGALRLSNAGNVFTGSFTGDGTGLTGVNADRLDGLDSAAFLQSIPVPLSLSGTSPSHILRADNASTALASAAVYGGVTGVSGITYGVRGQNASTAGYGVLGWATAASGTTYGVSGVSNSTSGVGVHGSASANTGSAFGGHFESDSTSGRGVFGRANAASGSAYGVYGLSDSTSGRGVLGYATAAIGPAFGLHGQSNSTGGCGVYGQANADTGITYGAFCESSSTEGRGVQGQATADTGTTYGGRFVSSSTEGRGVYGVATAASGSTYGGVFQSYSTNGIGVSASALSNSGNTVGVYAQSHSAFGYGVYGANTAVSGSAVGVFGGSASPSGRGVFGLAADNGIGAHYGVFGESFGLLSFGVYANGDLGASGSKPFRIDHPDDPENKYLLHYAAESPEVINFYRGTVVLDSAGEAVVELPHYFAKINKTPSYQLTAIGAPMPMLHVAAKIDEADLSAGARGEPGEAAPICSFRIAGGVRGGEVSWRVEALRNDRWVQKRGAPVEVEKLDLEKGTYQHPELYGMPEQRGMNYRPERVRASRSLSFEAGAD